MKHKSAILILNAEYSELKRLRDGELARADLVLGEVNANIDEIEYRMTQIEDVRQALMEPNASDKTSNDVHDCVPRCITQSNYPPGQEFRD